MANESVLCLVQSKGRAMQYKDTKKIVIDQRKLETLFRLGCPDAQIIQLLKTGTFTPTGDQLIDDTLESLLDHKIFNNNNWGGARQGAGAPKGNTNAKKNNQVNQENNQENNQDTDKDKDIINNSRVDVCLLDTTRTHARGKTVEEILQETTRNLSTRRTNSHLITPDFVFPKNQYFEAYRKELPSATARTEQWLRRSNLVGKQITETKLGQIIQKFATQK